MSNTPEKPVEWFDVVNEQDQVVGRAPRSEVHAKGLLHRAIHILIFNQQGEVFLQKRSAFKDLHPNVWDSSCSGHVDSGEDYDLAASRELGEELGLIPAPPLERLFYLHACPQTGQEFVWVYKSTSEGPFTLQPSEISEGRFFNREKVSFWITEKPADFAPAFIYLWKRAGY